MPNVLKFVSVFAIVLAVTACGGDPAGNARDSADRVKDAVSTAGEAAKAAVADAGQAATDAVGDAGAAAKTAMADSGGVVVAAAGPDLAAGEKTYGRFCFSCHAVGVAGAPKLGVAEDWAPRVAKGLDALVASTIEGIAPGMPARGLCSNCSDDDLRDVVAWMIAQQ